MNFPLRAKIVGVMSTLLTIMLMVVAFTYYRASQVDKDLSFMVGKVIPTLNTMSVIETHFLEQQIAYERLFRKMVTSEGAIPGAEDTLARIMQLGKLVDNEVAQAQSYLTADESYLSSHFMMDELIHITKLSGHLDVLEKEHEELEQHIQEMIELREREQFEALTMLNRVLEEETDDVNDVMGKMQRILKNLSESEAYHVLEQERNLHFASLYVAILAFLTGVLVAPRIASRIIKPLKAMNQGAKQIAGGDLNVTIEVNTRDEVGELGLAFNQMAKELQAKERIKDTFGKYIDPRIVEQLLIEQENFDLTSTEKKVMTVFFSDIAKFSTIAESLTPPSLVKMINQYFSLVSEPIMLRNGVIDKCIGDAIMAFWGAPFTSEDEQAKLACLAALKQFDKLDELNGQMGDILGFRKGLPNVDIRIGLCTGEVVAGNIGSTQSRSYTLMGDTVNIAARLESANKQFGTRILMNEDTYLRIKDDFVTRHIDKIVVVGKYEPVEIYELVGKVGDVEQLVIEKIGAYHQALAAYRQQQWSEALGWIAKSQAILPSDGPSEVLKKRIHQLQQQNLPQNWDGVWRLTGK